MTLNSQSTCFYLQCSRVHRCVSPYPVSEMRGNQTQGLTHARQTFYQLSYRGSLVLSSSVETIAASSELWHYPQEMLQWSSMGEEVLI